MKILFVGNPNSGKTALINAIAGSNLEVGNWPGVTVEKKEATFIYKNRKIRLIDLPGIYTLTPYSLEEKITRDVLANEKIDGIVDVVDSLALRRNLYLTLELIDMQKPMVMALNMFDEFTKRGYKLDIKKLESILGMDIVPTIASKGLGSKALIKASINAIEKRKLPKIQTLHYHIEKEIHFIVKRLEDIKSPYPLRLLAIKLLEKDSFAISLVKENREILDFVECSRKRLEKHMKLPIKEIITQSRYEIIDKILEKVLKSPIIDRVALTEKIDNYVLDKYLAFPIFFLIMIGMFKITFDGSAPLIDWVSSFFENFLAKYMQYYLSFSFPDWFVSLIIDGLISGVGLVLSFLPLLFLLYFLMAILEESGYMARVSFILDRVARFFGIKGNSFISMIMGFGCNVPAIYATRTMSSKRERVITSLMIPLMSCSARLPIYALFVSLFFTKYQAFIIMSLYIIGIVLAFIIAFIANKILPKKDYKPFLMELPTYHIPTIGAIWRLTWPKLKDFIIRAGSIILLASLILWFIIHLPPKSDIKDSYLAKSAQYITPIFKPLGFGEHWEPIAALIPGTIAKEVVISSLGTIYGVENIDKKDKKIDFIKDLKNITLDFFSSLVQSFKNIFSLSQISEDENPSSLKNIIKLQFSSAYSAYSYMLFVLIYIPCISTMAAIKQEFGWKIMIFEVLFLPLLAYMVSLLFYQISFHF